MPSLQIEANVSLLQLVKRERLLGGIQHVARVSLDELCKFICSFSAMENVNSRTASIVLNSTRDRESVSIRSTV